MPEGKPGREMDQQQTEDVWLRFLAVGQRLSSLFDRLKKMWRASRKSRQYNPSRFERTGVSLRRDRLIVTLEMATKMHSVNGNSDTYNFVRLTESLYFKSSSMW